MKSVYIHIPFCSNICTYCDFSKLYYNKKIILKYLKSLENEIRKNYNKKKIKTIYIGGGTPSSLDIIELEYLLKLTKIFNLDNDYEFTFECNPENMDEEKIKLIKKYGVNRVSIGVQSFNKNILDILGRKHCNEDVFKLINNLKKYEINNINIDLIFGINNQTIEDIKYDLDTFIKLNIPHISYYSLILEKNTKLYINNYKEINEDICSDMYEYICNYLKDNMYNHYEISNFSKLGYESKHNLTYWNNDEYYGFGLGTHGYINKIRYENTRSISKYLSGNYLLSEYKIDINTDIENEVMLGLRKIKGINKKEFIKKYKKGIENVFDLKKLIKDNLLIDDGNNIFINSKYIFVSNEVLVRIFNNMR